MLTELPNHVVLHGQTPLFTAETLPEPLRNWHQTEEDVWAKIVVSKGTAVYEILGDETESIALSPGRHGIIEPLQPHRLLPSADLEVQIMFFRPQS